MRIPQLRQWRELRGLTQRELAAKSGVSVRSIAGYEAGAGVRPNTARKLAEALDIEVVNFYAEPEVPKAPAPPSSQEKLFNNGVLEEERRALSLQSWTSLVNRLADRWEREIEEREAEWQAADRVARKHVKLLPNLNWANEISNTARDVIALATEELEAGLFVYTSEEAHSLFRALRRLDTVVDGAELWFDWVAETWPKGATVHDIREAAERKAAVERIGKRLHA